MIRYSNYKLNFNDLSKSNSINRNHDEPVLAVFSFKPGTINHLIKSFRHYELKIYSCRHLGITIDSLDQIPDSIPIMITVEIWGQKIFSRKDDNPLEDFADGRFDNAIIELCDEVKGKRTNVFFRFNPEMEVPAHRYPWQRWSHYIEAYEHFFKLCKIYAPQVKQVWGPSGYPGALEWYPGDDIVDAASVTIKSKSEMFLNVYPKNYPVEYDLFRRLNRLRFIDKPIFVIGSKFGSNDSINNILVSSISQLISENKNTIYSSENFQRPVLKKGVSRSRNIEIGVYDPDSLLNKEKPITVEQLFVDFGSLENGTFQKNFQKVIEREHNVIVTFEPFRHQNKDYDLKVLQHIADGI